MEIRGNREDKVGILTTGSTEVGGCRRWGVTVTCWWRSSVVARATSKNRLGAEIGRAGAAGSREGRHEVDGGRGGSKGRRDRRQGSPVFSRRERAERRCFVGDL